MIILQDQVNKNPNNFGELQFFFKYDKKNYTPDIHWNIMKAKLISVQVRNYISKIIH